MVLVTAQAEVDFCYLCAALDFVVTSAAVESSAAAASDESSGAKSFAQQGNVHFPARMLL